MVAEYALLSLLLVFALSLLVIRTGAIALVMTGLSPDVASFQSTSAFSGAGFTTEEAEQTVSTPGRRKIVKALIRLGSLGIVTAIATLVLSFVDSGGESLPRLLYLAGGAGLIILFARSNWFNRILTPVIERSLSRATDLDLRDYTQLLGLRGEYRVAEIDVGAEDWLAEESLAELNLTAEGIVVLGIERAGGTYVGAPGPETEIRLGDTLVVYGRRRRLRELSERETGDAQAHEDAVEEHEALLEAQDRAAG